MGNISVKQRHQITALTSITKRKVGLYFYTSTDKIVPESVTSAK